MRPKNSFRITLILHKKVTQKVKTVRYLLTIELIDGTLIHLMSEFSQRSFSLWRSLQSY